MCCIQNWQLLETLWFQQALDHAWVSFFSSFALLAERLLCFWLQLPVSPSQSSLFSGLVCCLELCDNGKCRLWGFKLDLVEYRGKFSFPPPPLAVTSPGEKMFCIFFRGKKKAWPSSWSEWSLSGKEQRIRAPQLDLKMPILMQWGKSSREVKQKLQSWENNSTWY